MAKEIQFLFQMVHMVLLASSHTNTQKQISSADFPISSLKYVTNRTHHLYTTGLNLSIYVFSKRLHLSIYVFSKLLHLSETFALLMLCLMMGNLWSRNASLTKKLRLRKILFFSFSCAVLNAIQRIPIKILKVKKIRIK